MAVTAQDIKKLREATNCGILDCKNALTESAGDFDAAVDILRKKGQAKAVKKAGREANEGVVVAKVDGNKAALVQLSCETDFVGNTDRFRAYASDLLAKAGEQAGNGEVTTTLAEQEQAAPSPGSLPTARSLPRRHPAPRPSSAGPRSTPRRWTPSPRARQSLSASSSASSPSSARLLWRWPRARPCFAGQVRDAL